MTALRLMLVAIWVMVSGFTTGSSDNSDPVGDFFSMLRPPKIQLPDLGIVPFWSNDFKRARGAYLDGDYTQAVKYFRRASYDGNMVADWYLGNMYRLGQGVSLDRATAYSYYVRVAENYDPEEPDPTRLRVAVDAQLRVADYLRTGIRSAKLVANPQTAARTYLRIATSYGHPRALYCLGTMSIEGEGMAKNPSQGLKWLNAAVRKHSPDAAAYLAELYATGTLVKQDDTRALMWYIVAAKSATKTENPIVFSRLNELRLAANEETRIEAEARARVWIEQNPIRPGE
ncbi:MAG: sel1 repeat family protein [Alphaproteobacteria bacterium]|nr:sel1 repeat family protein [Alphaproteobacteria bacterium]